jgi:hypothetical protein
MIGANGDFHFVMVNSLWKKLRTLNGYRLGILIAIRKLWAERSQQTRRSRRHSASPRFLSTFMKAKHTIARIANVSMRAIDSFISQVHKLVAMILTAIKINIQAA